MMTDNPVEAAVGSNKEILPDNLVVSWYTAGLCRKLLIVASAKNNMLFL